MSSTERIESRPSIEVVEARIASVLADPGIRHWLKDALLSAQERDPVDAAQDAALLAQLLGDKVDGLLADLAHRTTANG